jgi:hypothetical protein
MAYIVTRYDACGDILETKRAMQRRKVAGAFEDMVWDMVAADGALDTERGRDACLTAAKKAQLIRDGAASVDGHRQELRGRQSRVIIFKA